ncbi:MAG: DNA polymerase III subunit delta [Deltaproteobacteria bacterium]|jgi:DNA polymerase III delta subunit|nr:DNA polymerase III subunit delta [Deltaproteobacteria bacterium]
MDALEFEIEIASPKRKPFYLIVGGDPAARRRCLEAARKIVDPALFQLNYRQYGLDDLAKSNWKHISLDLTSNPFGKPPRIVVISLTEAEKTTAENFETLSKIKPTIIRNASLIMMMENAPDARLKFIREITKEGLIVDCPAPTQYNITSWLSERCRERSLRVGSEAIKTMVDRVGINAAILLAELDKLAIYPGTNTTITSDHIRSYVSLNSTANIYELAVPLGQGRLEKALPILLDLMEQTSPIQIIYTICTNFLNLIQIKVIIESHGGVVSDETVAAEMSLASYQVKRFREQLDNWTLASLKEALSAIQDSNRDMVTGRAPPQVALESLSVKLACLAKGPR